MGQEGEREERGNGGKDQQRWVQRRDRALAKVIDDRERKRRAGKVGRLLVTCLKIKVLSWPWLIFHHTPKLKMWTVITYLSNCLSSKGGCHIGFAKGQGSPEAGGKSVDQRLLIPPNTLQNYLVKGHLLQMEFLDCNTEWRWHDLKCNIWNGLGILIQHTFTVRHEYRKDINKIYHSILISLT